MKKQKKAKLAKERLARIGNTSRNTVPKIKTTSTGEEFYDEEARAIAKYFDENNIPYKMEYGVPMRTDLPEYIEMTCTRCKKTHNMKYDTYMRLLDDADPFEEMEFLAIACIYCHKGDMMPTKYLHVGPVIKHKY
jgi:hypothetical protein